MGVAVIIRWAYISLNCCSESEPLGRSSFESQSNASVYTSGPMHIVIVQLLSGCSEHGTRSDTEGLVCGIIEQMTVMAQIKPKNHSKSQSKRHLLESHGLSSR